ncbi:MAG: ribulose-phosphate 3-epimerase [Candidatus Omnitrophica bacterium]|nr:ribulose-phosphate 3-epimerase [Candidatus Omnitrophota bacterium]
MGTNIIVAPSILSADFNVLGEEVKAIASGGADWVHVDVMDGVFVPNITMGPLVVRSIRAITDLVLDVHLMIDNPIRHIDQFADAGSDIITFHVEACKTPLEIIKKIRSKGKKVGVSIKPDTDVKIIYDILDKVDMVLVMTVEPGFGGQSFMGDMVAKIRNLKERFNGDIEVDGGINKTTAKEVVSAGANVLVAGTAVFGQEDYAEAIRGIREASGLSSL